MADLPNLFWVANFPMEFMIYKSFEFNDEKSFGIELPRFDFWMLILPPADMMELILAAFAVAAGSSFLRFYFPAVRA